MKQFKLLERENLDKFKEAADGVIKAASVPPFKVVNDESKPLIAQALGKKFGSLPPVFQKKYQNRIFSDDFLVMKGLVDVESSVYYRFLDLIFKYILPPTSGKNLPAKIEVLSDKYSNKLSILREISLAQGESRKFNTKLQITDTGMVFESLGVGLCGGVFEINLKGDKISYTPQKYACISGIFNWLFKTKLVELMLGKVYIEEEALSEESFKLQLTIVNPVLGKIYKYSGRFKIIA